MAQYAYTRVQALLHDTNDAFLSCGGCVNTDYAEFAGMAISDFRHVLKRPDLRRHELISLLRKSMAKSQCDDPRLWPILMATQLKKSANNNTLASVH